MPATRRGCRADRPRPTCYEAAAKYPSRGGADRTIVLSTGRGDSRISPAEARLLAAELLALARRHEEARP